MTEVVWGVVCDAGPIIHLDELDSLPLLADFDRILIPEQVWQEVERYRPEALTQSGLPLQKNPCSYLDATSLSNSGSDFIIGVG